MRFPAKEMTHLLTFAEDSLCLRWITLPAFSLLKELAVRFIHVLLIMFILVGCGQKPVSYRDQIQPILNTHCIQCHGAEKPRGKVVLTSYETVANTRTRSGKAPLLTPGSLKESPLYVLCSTTQTHFRMPPDTAAIVPLTEQELELLRKWIAQGAKNN